MELVADHNAVAQARLAEEFRAFARLKKLIALKAAKAQEIEAAAFAVFSALGIENASGNLLDIYAKIAGWRKGATTEQSLRNRIRAQILINHSSGTIPQILEIFRLLTDLTRTIVLREGKAEIILYVYGGATDPVDAVDLHIILRRAKAGGIGAYFEWMTDTTANTFTLDDATSPGSTPGLGLGDATNPATGGKLAGGVK